MCLGSGRVPASLLDGVSKLVALPSVGLGEKTEVALSRNDGATFTV